MRTLLAAVAALSLHVTPAPAAHQDVVIGVLALDCYGCAAGGGYSTGTATFTVNGRYQAYATFDSWSSSGLCPALGSGWGTISGFYNGQFVWQQVGGAVHLWVDDTFRDGEGPGVLGFDGSPCGGNTTVTVTAVLAGV